MKGKKQKLLGILWSSAPSDLSRFHEAFRGRLRRLGYRNIAIEERHTEGKVDRLPDLAAELVGLKADVIVALGTPAVQAAKNATQTIPIVLVGVGDPVGTGLVASLARPGGNVTGVSLLEPELSGRRLELLLDQLNHSVPKVTCVAVLVNSANPTHKFHLQSMQPAAQKLGVTLQPVMVQVPGDLESAFASMTREHAGALIVLPDAMFNGQRQRVVSLAAKNRLPAMYTNAGYVQAGGLMSYGPSFPEMYRRVAAYVDKILKGVDPAHLPVDQGTGFEMVINRRAARAIGIPREVLMRADEVI